jgi:peptide/nickel transport system permease protein
VETVFSLPGVGQLVVTSVNQRNYPVVQGTVLVLAAMFILVNLVTDVVVGIIDPRVADSQFGA